MKTWSVLFLLVGLALAGYSQQNGCEDRIIVVNARDQKGNFVGSLQDKNFRAKIRGQNASVISVSAASSVHRVVFVLDTSGSMSPRFDRVVSRFATGEMVRSLPGDSRFALVIFAGTVLQTVPFGASRATILRDIDQLAFSPHKGPTDLMDSLLHPRNCLHPRNQAIR